jgi:tripartite-type tricarboxylate transporter receptor subunit TctC
MYSHLRVSHRVVAIAALAFAATNFACAQSAHPTRNIRMIVPFTPGGGADLHARTLGMALSTLWSRSVVIDNRGGAGGGVAASVVASSEPDGHTIFFATHPILSINPELYRKLSYDPVKDFAPVVKLGETALMLMVNPSFPAKTVAEMIKIAKEKPGTLNFGTGGPGTTQHLSAEMFRGLADIDVVHVPFKGGALASAAIMARQIQFQFDSAYPGMRFMQSGKLRGLAVTSKKRLPMLPDMPTMAETLPGYESVLAYTIVVPAATPKGIVESLNRDINKVLSDPAYRKELESRAISLDGGSPEDLRAWLAAERKKWGALIRKLKLSVG